MDASQTSPPPVYDRAYLKRLLADRNQYPDRIPAIDAEIHRVFNRTAAILVLDMCGFSSITAKRGIIHFLAMIDEMEQGAVPAVTGNGGQVIKIDADNLFAVFDDPGRALEAALDIFRAFDAINAMVEEDRDIRGSIGIGFGNLLVIGESDVFGEEMNSASKLGEDVGTAGEILLTAAAHQAVPPERYEFSPETFAIGSVHLPAYRFRRCLHAKP